jgi:hypothetical protein
MPYIEIIVLTFDITDRICCHRPYYLVVPELPVYVGDLFVSWRVYRRINNLDFEVICD